MKINIPFESRVMLLISLSFLSIAYIMHKHNQLVDLQYQQHHWIIDIANKQHELEYESRANQKASSSG